MLPGCASRSSRRLEWSNFWIPTHALLISVRVGAPTARVRSVVVVLPSASSRPIAPRLDRPTHVVQCCACDASLPQAANYMLPSDETRHKIIDNLHRGGKFSGPG